MVLVEPDNDKTIDQYNPETQAASFWQYNILFPDGTTDAGFVEKDIATNMLRSLIGLQDNDKPEAWLHGDVRNARIIKRKVTTEFTTERTDWELA